MLVGKLALGRRWTFVGGKGGVGKTTVAAAIAVELADAGEETLVLSVDPAHSLGDALGCTLGPEPTAVPGAPATLRAFEVDATTERDRFLAEWGDSIRKLIERGTYLDEDDARQVSDTTVPGIDELAALLRLARLAREFGGRVIVDTAPTGHTLRLLELPTLALGWIGALEAMERRHAAVAIGLVGEYHGDEATAFLSRLRQDAEAVRDLLRDPVATRMVLVTTPERAVVAETLRYQSELERLGIALGGVVANRNSTVDAPPGDDGVHLIHVPVVNEPTGLEGLRSFAAAAGSARPGPASAPKVVAAAGGVTVGDAFTPPLDRRLYIVGGKGGVGKTTVAAALSVHLAVAGRSVLLIGVDPAGSLGYVLGEGDDSAPAAGPSSRLHMRQVDASAAWSRFAERYREKVEALFRRVLTGGVSATHDQDVLERLMDLAPPGLDELVALLEMVDVSEDRAYDALVLDTAPTGHLLRLLEMPDLALDWCRTLMRLLLKYREVVPLSELGEEVLVLTRRIRKFQAQLRDPEATWFLAVALPESLSVPETERLLTGVRRAGVAPGALVINRSLAGMRVLATAAPWFHRLSMIDRAIPLAGAPALKTGPVGRSDLERFVRSWRVLSVV